MQFFFNILVYPVHKNLYYSLKFAGMAPAGHAPALPCPHRFPSASSPPPDGVGTVMIRC